MRCSRLLPLLLLPLGCAIPLDAPTSAPAALDTRPRAGGCLLFHDSPAVTLLQQARGSVVMPDGSTLWSLAGATLAAGESLTRGLGVRVSGDDATRCFPATPAGTGALFAPSPLNPDFLLSPLDLVRVGDEVWSYYQAFQLDSTQVFGVRSVGFGVAPWDETSGQFRPTVNLLWSGDGPAYGTSVLLLGTDLYVYGCQGSSCYAAKVAADQLDDPAAYSYATGAGRFATDPAAARPILNDVGGISVRPHLSGRLLVTYVPPIGGAIIVRSALGPTGPFSREHVLGTCELGGAGDFCVGGVRHPELETDTATVAVSYAAANFDGTPPGDRYWSRLAFVPLPAALP